VSQVASASAIPAYVVSSQTLALSAPITIGTGSSATVVSLATDSAGATNIIEGSSTIPLASYLSSNPSVSQITQAPFVPTSIAPFAVAGLTLSQNSQSNALLLGSLTLTPGETITQGGRGSAATVVGITVASGTPEIIIQDASTTQTSVLPSGAFASLSASPEVVTYGGSTITLSAATLAASESQSGSISGSGLNALETGSVQTLGASGFFTSTTATGTAALPSMTGVQSGAIKSGVQVAAVAAAAAAAVLLVGM